MIASVLFSSATVADYAVAARLAALFTFFQLALLKRFAPRAGRLAAARTEHAPARRSRRVPPTDHRLHRVDHRRRAGAGARVVAAARQLHGGARAADWLAIPSFVQSFYATSDRLLIIAGQANVALILTASSFAVLMTTPFATAPWLGPFGDSCRHDVLNAGIQSADRRARPAARWGTHGHRARLALMAWGSIALGVASDRLAD